MQMTGSVKERVGSASNTASPRNVYRCADGKYVALSGSTQAMAKRIFETIGRADMNEDPRFRHQQRPGQAPRRWSTRPSAAGSRRARATKRLTLMREASATVGPVYTIADAMTDRAFPRARGSSSMWRIAELGSVPMHNILPRLSETPGGWQKPAPGLGEHTDAVLMEAGLDRDAIARLRASGAAA